MSALYRFVLLNPVSKINQQSCFIQVRRFGYTTSPQWMTRNGVPGVGNTAITQKTKLRTMANKSEKDTFSCLRLLSNLTEENQTATVKRVSIEGNIGK